MPQTVINVPSQSSDSYYEVIIINPDDSSQNICECEGYVYRGHCSHQNEAMKYLCSWQEGEEPQTPKERRLMLCPRCKSQTTWIENA